MLPVVAGSVRDARGKQSRMDVQASNTLQLCLSVVACQS